MKIACINDNDSLESKRILDYSLYQSEAKLSSFAQLSSFHVCSVNNFTKWKKNKNFVFKKIQRSTLLNKNHLVTDPNLEYSTRVCH